MKICPIMPKVTFMCKKEDEGKMSDAAKWQAELKKIETMLSPDLAAEFKKIDNYEDLMLVSGSYDWFEYDLGLPTPLEALKELKSPGRKARHNEDMALIDKLYNEIDTEE